MALVGNDAECVVTDAGTSGCDQIAACVYDTDAQHWACHQQACCAP